MTLPFPYTIVGYLDLWEIHPVCEHVFGASAKDAIARLKEHLRANHQEYRETLAAREYEPLTVTAVFENHLHNLRRRPPSDLWLTPANCTLCGVPLPRGMAVTVNRKPFHPGCAVTALQERKNGRSTTDPRGGAEDHATRPDAGPDAPSH